MAFFKICLFSSRSEVLQKNGFILDFGLDRVFGLPQRPPLLSRLSQTLFGGSSPLRVSTLAPDRRGSLSLNFVPFDFFILHLPADGE